jgi:hypothetical protein
MGLSVQPFSSASGFDLLVNGTTRITLRVAFPGMRRHRVTVAGRRYQYRYRTWHFNFHHHGRLGERYTDFFVCFGEPAEGDKGAEIFVIPWDAVTGKTFSLHGGRRQYKGRYAAFRDGWSGIAAQAHGSVPPLRRVA